MTARFSTEAPPSDIAVPAGHSRAGFRQWVALLGAMLGAFMAVLDIQITNASLGDILGSLGATFDEGSWVTTSYLVAEIIVIPLTGWLTEVFSARRYLLLSAALFLGFSVGCAFAWNLESMIGFRILQGLTGGALIPMAFNLVLQLLAPDKRGPAFAIFGMTATFAPAIGPTLGGWLTNNWGWPSIFYMNLLPGSLLMVAVGWGLKPAPAKWTLFKRGDWWGISTMAVGLGSFIVFLEEGHRHDWFNSAFISWLAATSVVFLVACVMIELKQSAPFINLRLLADRNFGLGTLIGMAFGAGMYGATYLLPVYLAQVQGYNAQQIGETIMWSGMPQLIMMPVAAALLRRIDARVLVGLGLALFSGSSFLNASMTNLTGYDQLRFTQFLRALGMPLVIVPLTSLATAHLRAEQAGSASALFNMLRNLGGSIGVAFLATQVDVREKLHSLRLSETLNAFYQPTVERLNGLTQHFIAHGSETVTGNDQALSALAALARREAYVMSFGDCFFLLGIILLVMLAPILFTRAAARQTLPVH